MGSDTLLFCDVDVDVVDVAVAAVAAVLSVKRMY